MAFGQRIKLVSGDGINITQNGGVYEISNTGGSGGSELTAGRDITIDDGKISTRVAITKLGEAPPMKIWRWTFQQNEGDPRMAVAEVNCNNTDGVMDLSTGTATASAVYLTPTHSADKAFDRSTSTTWQGSTATEQWLQIEAQEPISLVSYSIRRYSTSRIRRVKLQASNDGIEWLDFTDGWEPLTFSEHLSQPIAVGNIQVPAFIGDAPKDGKEYVRRDGEWVEVITGA